MLFYLLRRGAHPTCVLVAVIFIIITAFCEFVLVMLGSSIFLLIISLLYGGDEIAPAGLGYFFFLHATDNDPSCH